MLRGKYLIDIKSHNLVLGLPFTVPEITDFIKQHLAEIEEAKAAEGSKEA